MMLPGTEEPSREDDETAARILLLAAHEWGLSDIATDAGLDRIAVIEILHAHRDCFRTETFN